MWKWVYKHTELHMLKNIYTLARTEPREAWEKKAMFEFYVKAMKPIGKKYLNKIKMSMLTEQIPPSKNPWTRWVLRTLQIKCVIEV